ncbi:bifunctional riboflavin kinase/FAD synthetase [Sedimentitalea arenosa]|uniref:Riboflavin biosynthesis protein n=1 Tax=Sedimentitalea arenosa TaxID=2798803 RepID=A0A8J7J6A1_9RHOB|nr:bifunctional riboflavin kinase/FAD synthetase [Arenibacterium arenosum]MBJ6372245.1 bifunctional riboflavin kinase/FAD synthetase [Arenibacterium arenosum]
MRIVRDYQFVEPQDRGASVAIGNFDGVHLGHRSVIELARKARPDVPLGVMTFEPHPREFFAPDAPPFRLMGRQARAHRLQKLGVDRLYELAFNAQLAGLSPRAFAQTVICDGLGLAHVVVGHDFCFGKGRAGTADDLVRFGAEMGFGVSIAPLLERGENTVSSTAIRTALSEGRPRDAADMLGHWHRIEGKVIAGEQRGRELGYPTANMSIEGLHPPAFGVYAVLADVLDGPHAGSYHGAASIGVRPMFGENRPNLETFIFDFKGDLYGATLSIGLVEHLRPEMKFDSLDALITQMDADCGQARAILSSL